METLEKILETPGFGEVARLLGKINLEKPDQKHIEELREILTKHPDAWKLFGDLTRNTYYEMLAQVNTTALVIESVGVALEALRRDLGYAEASPLERLLVDQVILCWLRQHLTEDQYTQQLGSGQLTVEQGEYWERRLSAVQRRYLRACETLARVRKLTRATLQINIATQGGQQVNVAGDVKSERTMPSAKQGERKDEERKR